MSAKLFLVGTSIICLTVVFHVIGLVTLATVMKLIGARLLKLGTLLRTVLLLGTCVFGVLFLHVIEAWAWAGVYMILGEFDNVERALYFSIVTSTTLGYGDITLSEHWQLLSTFEAMGGLILFGATTAFLLGVMGKMFGNIGHPETKATD